MEKIYHIPALLQPTIQGLKIRPDGTYVDVTFGGGGHSRAIMQALGTQGRLYSMDQDIDAYANRIDDERWQFVHGNFRYLRQFMDFYGEEHIDGLMADLGVSFHHFDEAERGFSFRFPGPLDMRMNQKAAKSAADIVNTYDEEQLCRVLYLYGELKNARALAHRMVVARAKAPIQTIDELVWAMTGCPRESVGERPGIKKELILAFQALRIEVNDELGALQQMLLSARDLLCPGGRMAILTYHSLEDRIVKNFLRSGNVEGHIDKDFYGNILTPFTVIEKGLTADAQEIEVNPRARSAKLRIGEKK